MEDITLALLRMARSLAGLLTRRVGLRVSTPHGPGTIVDIENPMSRTPRYGVKLDKNPFNYPIAYYFKHELSEPRKARTAADWGRAQRRDYEEPPEMDPKDRRKAERVRLEKDKDSRTWWNVYLRGKFLGRVRTTMGGYQEYTVGNDRTKKYHGGMVGNERDPDHAFAILALLDVAR